VNRKEPVVVFGERPADAATQRVLDTLGRTIGKLTSLVDVCLLSAPAGHVVTDAASGAGTALTVTRTQLDFADAAIDSVRLVVRGQNSAAGSVVIQVYNVTQSMVMATATITGTSEQIADSGWWVFRPVGGDEVIEVHVQGDDAADPMLFNVHMQGRTVSAQP
jgi:hypothetical protein